MRDVSARTGLARSTIHHYIREGLLPRPRKTGRNTAIYDEDFVKRAQLIKALQRKAHMPLAVIKETLDGMPEDAVDAIDPDRFTGITRAVAEGLRLASEQPMGEDDLVAASGLSAAELAALRRAKLIEATGADGNRRYSPLDVRITLAMAKIREAGATLERGFAGSPQIIKAYRHHLTELARVEAREMVRMMRRLAEFDLDEFIAQTVGPLGELVAALHRKALVEAITDLTENGTDGKG